MNKSLVTKFLILGMLSLGFIACGPAGSDSAGTSGDSDFDDSLKGTTQCSEGGSTRSVAEGGSTKCATVKKVPEGGSTSPLPATEGGSTLKSNNSGGFEDISAEFADDETVRIHGLVANGIDTVAFVVNGTDNYEVNVNADGSFSVEIGVTAEDKEEMIVDFVAGKEVQTFVMLDEAMEFHQF